VAAEISRVRRSGHTYSNMSWSVTSDDMKKLKKELAAIQRVDYETEVIASRVYIYGVRIFVDDSVPTVDL
jgi:hypothetical protein